MRITIKILTAAFVMFISTPVMSVSIPDYSPADVRTLKRLADRQNVAGEGNKPLPGSGMDSCPVTSLRAALLYAHSPATHKGMLFRQFSINDYPARSKGEYKMMSSEEVLGVVKTIEAKYPQFNAQLNMVIAFCVFRNLNVWFDTNRGRISAARFFRTAFLASVLHGNGHDVVQIADEIDFETQRRGGY